MSDRLRVHRPVPLVVTFVVAVLAATSAPWTVGPSLPRAAAHGAAGTLGVEATVTGAQIVRVRTLLRYASDGHTVPGATVTVGADGPDAASAGPVVLADTGGGTYVGDLTLPGPGTWSLVVRSPDPAAEARTTVVVPPPGAPGAAGSAVPPTAAPTSTADRSRTGGDRRTPDPDTDPLVGVAEYLVVVLGVALVTATLWVGLRRRR